MKKGNVITISDVAEALGVSKTTVSRAISGKGRIGEATRQKVLAYIEEHDYKPNVIARGLAQSKTFNLCVVMPEDYALVDLPFFQEVITGIQEIAGMNEYDILLCICQENDITSLERIVRNRKVDGIVLLRTFLKDPQIELLLEKKIPFVTTGSTAYRKVKRYKGYQQAYQEAGREVEETLVYRNLESRAFMDRAVEEVLEKGADCIVCMDDAICIQVLRKLRQEHIKVPQDIRVASFYNSSVLENNIPSITSLSFNARELGMEACKNLLAQIEGETVPDRTLLSYEVVLKESTK